MTRADLSAALSALTPPPALKEQVLAVCSAPAAQAAQTARQHRFRLVWRSSFAALAACVFLLVLSHRFTSDIGPLATPQEETRAETEHVGSTGHGNVSTEAAIDVSALSFSSLSELAAYLLAETDWTAIYVPDGPFTSIEYRPAQSEVCFYSGKATTVRVIAFANRKEAAQFVINAPGFRIAGAFAHNEPLRFGGPDFSAAKRLTPLTDLIEEKE